MRNLILIGVIGAAIVGVAPAQAKEYNKRTHIDPAQQVKVQRVLAQAFKQDGRAPQGATNVGCGKLEIGRVVTRPGERLQEVDRDIIITGDVINVASGCRR